MGQPISGPSGPSGSAAMSEKDQRRLKWATRHLEHPSLAARLTSLIGTPIEIGIKLLPRPMYKRVLEFEQAAVNKALQAALVSLRHAQGRDSRNLHYKVLVAGSGMVGGAFGIFALPFEFGVTTAIMLRSIAEIARCQGEDLNDPDTQAACVEVFALGGEAESDDAADTGYYGVRLALGWSVTHAAWHIARHGSAVDGPLLANLLAGVSSRFGVALSQKAAAVMVPVVGAVSAAAINTIFMNHYQEMARGHFVVRRLERKYGQELVKTEYERLVVGA